MNTTRIPKPALKRFGLFAVIKSKRVILPLKGVECDFSVVSGIAEVSMTHIFRQENEKPLDCEYLFPLPADASVYFCEADINGRTIRAQVRERDEARQLAATKKAAGFRTALVESERDNLFTLSLGNVQPGDLVIIKLKYFQTLRSLAEMPSIEIPFCPGIRYIPGKRLLRSNKGKGTVDDTDEVPDASRITPVRIDADHPDAAFIEVRGTLDGEFVDENAVASPSHPILVQRAGKELRVTLSDKGDVPDRDFVLRWSEKDAEAVCSRVWIREKGNEAYALLEVRAPKDAPAERAPVDFYFLVDRSGSMSGEKWNKAAEALQSCMRVLGPADRAMVTFFESSFQDFAERPLPVRELLEDRQFQKVKELGAAGGTELRPALEHVLDVAAKYSASRSRNLILITDAQVGNEFAILELMKTAPDVSVHCFGIDVALNDALLLALSRQQGGTYHSLNPRDDIEKAVTTLGRTLGQPVLLDLRLSDGWEIADAKIPNLYAGQIHYLSARSSKGVPLELAARTPVLENVTIQFERQTPTLEAPYLHWCRSRIDRLVAEGNEKAAIALSVESNLICGLTAFIAWDESEKVAVASHHLVQPNMDIEMGVGATVHFLGRTPRLKDVCYDLCAPACDISSKWTAEAPPQLEALAPQAPALPPHRESPDLDELVLRRELADICHRAGVPDWQPLVDAILNWIAGARGAKRSRRIEELHRLIEDVRIHALRLDQLSLSQDPKEADELRQQIHGLLKSFVDALPAKK